MKRLLVVVRMMLVAVALFVTGCRGCGSGKHVAEMTKHRGDVSRDTDGAREKWRSAADGEKLAMGDALKTGSSSEAVVHLTTGGTLKLPSDTTIRFLASAPGTTRPGLAVETGEASIEADDGELVIQTTIGLAHIESGGKLRVSATSGGSTRVEVSIGAARIDTESGGVVLSPGKSFEVSLGGAIIERETVDASADAAKPAEAAAPAQGGDAGAGQVVVDVHGKGVRVQARGTTTWQALAEGSAAVNAGDALEVPSGASVDVRRGARRATLAGVGRYVVGDTEGGALVRASAGHLEVEATTEDILVEVPGGVILAKTAGADGKSRVEADIGANGTKVSVRQGQGEVRGKTPETVRAGESAMLSAKGVVVVSGRGPERADFTVRGGESFVVRDPRPPTAVGFDFSSVCPGAAVVSRPDGASARGEHLAAMLLAAGHHEYAIRCIGPDGVEAKPAATGSVTIVADAARAEFSRLPPSTVVDMDGRRYTVLYQNLLPSVVVRWPEAPPATGYVLHLDAQRLKSASARQSLKPGSVGEGTHVLSFEAEDGSKRSPETTLVIKFDNAAPAASVREPADGSFQPGDTVKVSGVVIEGWTVTVYGQAVALDEQKRFSTTATVPAAENALVLRLHHAQRGSVYYVRHAGGKR